jgi:serpin B
MNRNRAPIAVVALCASAAGVYVWRTNAAPAPPRDVEVKRVVAGQNELGCKMLRMLSADHATANILISPYSLANLIAMTQNGAAGKTRVAMADTLGLQGLTPSQINDACSRLDHYLKRCDRRIELTRANSVWARREATLLSGFSSTASSSYDATVATIDFKDPGSLQAINRWVSGATGGKIESAVASINQDVMLLINATYFHGNWRETFDESMTSPGEFHITPKRARQVPFMFKDAKFTYGHFDTFDAVELPYGSGRIGFYVLLPHEQKPLAGILDRLNGVNVNKWVSNLAQVEGEVKLPRMDLKSDLELKDVLARLGMGSAFSSTRADFSAMSGTPLWISSARQNSLLQVDEAGTTAASVTTFHSAGNSVPTKFSFVADRPFVYLLRENATGSLLFAGVVREP